jgi:hypothetical protein
MLRGTHSSLTRSDIDSLEAYALGRTFSDAEREYLLPLIMSLNGAISELMHECHAVGQKRGISVRPSGTGNGLFCDKKVPKRLMIALYFGTLEVDSRYDGRRDYAIQLPKLRLAEGGPLFKIILCGYSHRDIALNAVMLNHVCSIERVNVIFEPVPVVVYADLGARHELRTLQAKNAYAKVPPELLERASKVAFEYVAVVARVVKPVPAGEEFLVSYNQAHEDGREDHEDNYFMPRGIAATTLKRNDVMLPCVCEPARAGGPPAHCPWDRVFVINRAFLSSPPP